MKNKIDLHGLSHAKALIEVEEFLLMNSFNNDLELELITGKSPKLQQKIIDQILKKHKFKFSQFTLIQLMVSVGLLFLIPQSITKILYFWLKFESTSIKKCTFS